jgi:TRAP-type C4-dicarboxylate transport system substrate-binding protein
MGVCWWYREQTTAFEINVLFGFSLRHMETGELRYYHSSLNNSRFFDVPHLIRTEEDLEKFLDELQGQEILDYIRQKRPDTVRHWSSTMNGQASEKA